MAKGWHAFWQDRRKWLKTGCKHTALWECSEVEERTEKEKLQELTL
jgi:hypothetical protein